MPAFKRLFSSGDGKKLVRKQRPHHHHQSPVASDAAAAAPWPLSPPSYEETVPLRHHAFEQSSALPEAAPVLAAHGRRPPPSLRSFAPSERSLPAYETLEEGPARYSVAARTNPRTPRVAPPRAHHQHQQAVAEEPTAEAIALDIRRKQQFANLKPAFWARLVTYLDPATAACLKMACRAIYQDTPATVFATLELPENRESKIAFLRPSAKPNARSRHFKRTHGDQLDAALPEHLFCYNCITYHRRLDPNLETLGIHHDHIGHPVFVCPLSRALPTPRLCLTPQRRLPFTLPQLLARTTRHGPLHGISPASLSKTWSDKAHGFDEDDDAASNWRHNVAVLTHHGHILLRVESTHPTPNRTLSASEVNRLLLSRASYAPYFSTCQHYAHGGRLVDLAKCAIQHQQAEVSKAMQRGSRGPGTAASISQRVPSQCAECRPARRCDDCGTEYVITLRLAEDRAYARRRSLAGYSGAEPGRFVTHLCVTRYSDLGPCVSPDDVQWLAVAGDDGERDNEVRSVCQDMGHLKSVRSAFEIARGAAGGGGEPVSLSTRIDWVRQHCQEVQRDRSRVRSRMAR